MPFQAKWIKDQSRLKLMEKSRQIGITWSTAYGLVRSTSRKEERLDSWVSSRDEIQARLFLEDCQQMAGILHVGAKALGELVLDEAGKLKAHVLEFANGRRIHSMSSNPDAQAGKRGTRVLDEFCLHPDQRKLYAIAYPGITWGGRLEIVSTHRGAGSLFNELLVEAREKGNPKGWSVHRVTLQDALDQGFLRKLKAKLPAGDERLEMDEAAYFDFIKAGCTDEETFMQEYMCVPADESTAFITYEMLTSCAYRAGDAWQIPLAKCVGPLYVGVDVGRVRDLFVIWVLERLGDVLYTRFVLVLENTPFPLLREALYQVLAERQVRRCCMDATGLGRQLAEEAALRFGRSKVEGLTFTPALKEELAYPLRAHFEDHTIRIPADPLVTADFRGIKKEYTTAGNVRFAADRGKNGHSDRFWAAALACHAGENRAVYVPPAAFTQNRRARIATARRNREVVAA